MKILNVCFREVKNGKFKGEIDCVLLDFSAGHYNQNIECYSHVGQHSVGEYDYFKTKTKKAKEYSNLLSEIKNIYTEFEVVVHERITKKFYTN